MATQFNAEDIAELEKAAARAVMGGRVWFVATTGNDSNAATKSAPFLTVQNAHDAASPGDTIHIEPGTYTGILSVTTKGLTFRGVDPVTTIIVAAAPDADAVGVVGGGITFKNLKFVTVGDTGQDCVNAQNTNDVLFDNCWFVSGHAAVVGGGSTRMKIRNCYMQTSCIGLTMTGAKQFTLEDSLVEVTYATSLIANTLNASGITTSSTTSGIIRNTPFIISRSINDAGITTGINAIGRLLLSNVPIIVSSTHASATGAVYGIKDSGSATKFFTMDRTSIVTSAGNSAQAIYDIVHSAGVHVDTGGSYFDISKVSGSQPSTGSSKPTVTLAGIIGTASSRSTLRPAPASYSEHPDGSALSYIEWVAYGATIVGGDYVGNTLNVGNNWHVKGGDYTNATNDSQDGFGIGASSKSNITIEDVLCRSATLWASGMFFADCTRVTIKNSIVVGSEYGIVFDSSGGGLDTDNWRIENTHVENAGDYASSSTIGVSNSTAQGVIENADILTVMTPDSGFDATALSNEGGIVTVNGGTIRAKRGASANSARFANAVSVTSGGTTYLNGVSLYSSGGYAQYDIRIDATSTCYVCNCTYDPNKLLIAPGGRLIVVTSPGNGVGPYPIDHNGGSGLAAADITVYLPYSGTGVGSSTDVLKFTSNGTTGVNGLTIRAYLASDYDAGIRSVIATQQTKSDGRWVGAINLWSGTYYLEIDAPGDPYNLYRAKVVVP